MGRVIAAFAQFFDGSGAPLQRGWLRFLESGSNNTDKNTFYDPVYQIPNANPLQLDGEGRCPNVFGTGDYRVISFLNDPEDEDSPGEQIQQFDPVTAEAAAATGGGAGSFGIWDSLEEYSLGDIVTYNTVYYRSLIAGNLGNNPAIEEYAWERVDFLRFYNSTITYSEGDLVFWQYNLYLSKQALNQGNDPADSPAWWRPVATGYHDVFIKTTDYEILPTEFDSIFVLDSTAIANSQFDLPAMDATTDRFRVAIYNASDYDLTVNALGSTIWIDTSGDIILTKGAFAEFIYSNDLGQWLVFGSVGPTLGAQDIGTDTTPAANAYIDYLHETLIPDDEKLHFGDDSDFFISYDSIADVLSFNDLWLINAIGELIPDATNANKNIGNATNYLASGYITNLLSSTLTMPDGGLITIGVGNTLTLSSNDSLSYLYSAFVGLYMGTTTANDLHFVTNNADRGYISAAGELLFTSNIYSTAGATYSINGFYCGSGYHFRMLPSGVHGVINANTGNLYLQTQGTTVLTLDTANNATFAGAVVVNGVLYAQGGMSITGNLTVSGQIQYGTLTDGATVLSATIAEINQRCDGIPFVSSATGGAVAVPASSFASCVTLNLGTVNADSYAIVEIGFLSTTTGISNVFWGKNAGTANVFLAGFANPADTVIRTMYSVGALTYWTKTYTMQVTSTGSLVLGVQGFAGVGGGTVTNAFIRVTWIKKT